MVRRASLAALAILLTVPAAALDIGDFFHRGEKGDGEMTTVTYDLADCDEIDLKCGLDIDIRFGREQRVALTVDGNLVEMYEIAARGDRLVVDADDNPRPSRGARLELTLRALSRVKISGAGDITVAGYEGDELELAISGAGDVELDGSVGTLEIRLDGAGDIDARRLEARVAAVTVNGAGDVRVFASESADIEVNGVGDVDVYGDPRDLDKSVHGIGSVARR